MNIITIPPEIGERLGQDALWERLQGWRDEIYEESGMVVGREGTVQIAEEWYAVTGDIVVDTVKKIVTFLSDYEGDSTFESYLSGLDGLDNRDLN